METKRTAKEEAHKVIEAEAFRKEAWIIGNTEPIAWASWVYFIALRERPWLAKKWEGVRLEFMNHFGKEARAFSMNSARRLGGSFDSFRRRGSRTRRKMVQDYITHLESMPRGSGLVLASAMVEQFVDDYFNSSQYVLWIALFDFMAVAAQVPERALSRLNPMLTEILQEASGIPKLTWQKVIREKTMSERMFGAEGSTRNTELKLIREKTLLKYSRAWVDHNIGGTPGGFGLTMDEVATALEMEMPNLSLKLKAVDEALNKKRERGAPLGRSHRGAYARGELKIDHLVREK